MISGYFGCVFILLISGQGLWELSHTTLIGSQLQMISGYFGCVFIPVISGRGLLELIIYHCPDNRVIITDDIRLLWVCINARACGS